MAVVPVLADPLAGLGAGHVVHVGVVEVQVVAQGEAVAELERRSVFPQRISKMPPNLCIYLTAEK